MVVRRPWISFGAALAFGLLLGCTMPSRTDAGNSLMEVESVKIDPRTSSPVVLLREQDGEHRRLPIWIGVFEARSIAMAMEKIESPRPNTHDLIQNLFEKLEGKILRVVITELKDNTYYALLEVQVNGRKLLIDSRPSDAIAVATRTGTPVYATAEVLNDAGIPSSGGPALEVKWRGLESVVDTLQLQIH